MDRLVVEERQVPVRRRAREDLDVPRAREVGERAGDVAVEARDVRRPERAVDVRVERRELASVRVALRLEALAVGVSPADLVVDVLDRPVDDVAVGELIEEDRRDADRHAERHVRGAQIVQRGEDREVRAEHGLVDPLLSVRPAAGAARVRQVRMQHEREGVRHRPILSAPLRACSRASEPATRAGHDERHPAPVPFRSGVGPNGI